MAQRYDAVYRRLGNAQEPILVYYRAKAAMSLGKNNEAMRSLFSLIKNEHFFAFSDLLSLVARLGITVIAVLHDLTLIEDFASHVALIDDGRLAAYGHPQEVLSGARVRETFEVDMHRLPHPFEDRLLCALDIPISRPINRPVSRTGPRPVPSR